MAHGKSSSPALVRGAERALDQMKHETARRIGPRLPESNDWGDLPARRCGQVGGKMVRRMIEMAEESLASPPIAARRSS